jgi:hypothetical protein
MVYGTGGRLIEMVGSIRYGYAEADGMHSRIGCFVI